MLNNLLTFSHSTLSHSHTLTLFYCLFSISFSKFVENLIHTYLRPVYKQPCQISYNNLQRRLFFVHILQFVEPITDSFTSSVRPEVSPRFNSLLMSSVFETWSARTTFIDIFFSCKQGIQGFSLCIGAGKTIKKKTIHSGIFFKCFPDHSDYDSIGHQLP